MRVALVRDGIAENVVLAEALDDVRPEDGIKLLEVDDTVSAGDLYDGAVFTRPAPPEPEPDRPTVGMVIDVALSLGVLSISDLDPLLLADLSQATVAEDGNYEVEQQIMDAVVAEVVGIPVEETPIEIVKVQTDALG